jgi:CheY-like chemotaxis protein
MRGDRGHGQREEFCLPSDTGKDKPMISTNEPATTAQEALHHLEWMKARATRVLLAEDDTEMRRFLSGVLLEDGYRVVEADNGIELLKRLEPSMIYAKVFGRILEYDMVVSDIRMPGLSGLDVLSALRKYDKETPIVLITAFGDDETHARAMGLGASAVIDKPFDVDELRALLWKTLPPSQ